MIPITKAAKGEDLMRKLIKNQVGKPDPYYVRSTAANRVTYSLGTLHYSLGRQISGTLEHRECLPFISVGGDGLSLS